MLWSAWEAVLKGTALEFVLLAHHSSSCELQSSVHSSVIQHRQQQPLNNRIACCCSLSHGVLRAHHWVGA